LIDTGASDNWDSHGNMQDHRPKARRVDRPLAGLIRDLKRRGLLGETLVAICTEFGRTPYTDGPGTKGRNHYARAFSGLLACGRGRFLCSPSEWGGSPRAGEGMKAGSRMPGTCVVGLQWGDEAKGKIVDLLTDSHDFVVRYNGGANAGHTVVANGKTFKFSLLPTGVLHPHLRSVIANGVVVNPVRFLEEVQQLRDAGVS